MTDDITPEEHDAPLFGGASDQQPPTEAQSTEPDGPLLPALAWARESSGEQAPDAQEPEVVSAEAPAEGCALFAAERYAPTLEPDDEPFVDKPLWGAPADSPVSEEPADAVTDDGEAPVATAAVTAAAATTAATWVASDPASEAAVTTAMQPVGIPEADAAEASAAAAWAALSADAPEIPGADPSVPVSGIPRDVDLGPEAESRWWLWVLIALAVIAVVGGIAYAVWYNVGRPIAVPDVVGKQSAQATQSINDAGLVLGKVLEQPSDSATAGTVISQVPDAGEDLRPGDTVTLTVAISPDEARVPDVVGKTLTEAQETLASEQLLPVVVKSYNATAAADYVVSQLPTASAELPPGASVAIIVSKGPAPATVSVPRLAGLNEAEATRLVEGVNLKLATFRSYNASVAAGDVVTQTPSPRTSVPYGATVQVLISRGPGVTPVTVPNVSGTKQAAAEKSIKAAGLQVKVRRSVSASVASGTVIAQTPPAGSRTAAGAEVGILVSSGQVNSVKVPSVVGTATAAATETISDIGLKAVVLEVPLASAAQGVVLAQFPAAGGDYPRGFPVVIMVAKPLAAP